MNKELTDLQDIKSAFISHCKTLGCEDAYIKVCENKFGNIETALKRLEEIDNRPFINGIREEIPADVICKKLKALEIIKDKKVSVLLLNFCFKVEEYNWEVSKERRLTQEEFDLLKEVLK